MLLSVGSCLCFIIGTAASPKSSVVPGINPRCFFHWHCRPPESLDWFWLLGCGDYTPVHVSYVPCSPEAPCPTPRNGLNILLQTHQGNSSLLHPPAILSSPEALPLPSPFFWLILILFLSLLWLSVLVVPKGCVGRSPQLVQPGSAVGMSL